MPTLELHGYSANERDALVLKLKSMLSPLEYHNDIIFVHGESRVIGWDGASRPFVRVLSRRQERADEIGKRLSTDFEVETAVIGFIPKVSG